MTSPPRSIMPVASILDNLDTPGFQVDELTFLAYGDDLLDFAVGLDSLCKNRWLLNCEPLPTNAYGGEAVCVGSGPSLDANIDTLQRIKDRVLIVAAHSAISKLLANGIVPHVITPKERNPDPEKIPQALPESVVYAGLPVVQYAPGKCQRHYLVGDSGRQAEWMGYGRQDIKISATSGSLSAWVAAALCPGKIWLVGHDMTQGHYAGFAHAEEAAGGTIMCADGTERPSCWVYRACQAEFVRLAEERVVIQTAPSGARIEGAEHRALDPALGRRPDLSPRPTDYAMGPHPQLSRIPAIFNRVITACESATDFHGMDLDRLFLPEDRLLGLTIMQPVWLQYSIFKRTLGITDAQATACMRESILNAFRCMLPWARKATHGLG